MRESHPTSHNPAAATAPTVVVRTLLVLALALACVVTTAAAADASRHNCIHDQIVAHRLRGRTLAQALDDGLFRGVAKLRAPRTYVSRGVDGADAGATYEPLRIKVFAEDVLNTSKHCTAANEQKPSFMGFDTTCSENDILTAAKRDMLLNTMIPAAVKMHEDRLRVQPLAHIDIGTSTDYQDGRNEYCSSFQVPEDVRLNGVDDADFVIFVAAGPMPKGYETTVAWATTCAITDDARPYIGVINIKPQFIDGTDQSTRTIVHEMMHALGFSSTFFEFFKLVSSATNVRGKDSAPVLVGPKVIQRAGNQYGCNSIIGAEVDDSGGEGTYGSHWHFRNGKDDLMCGYVGPAMKYTAMTMAAMEDLGFYKPNYDNAEHMEWSFKAGCKLLDDKCLMKEKTQIPAMFCDEADAHRCTSDRMSVGKCTIRSNQTIPPPMQYFSDPTRGGFKPPDFCPLFYQSATTLCEYGATANLTGSLIGVGSRCVDMAPSSQLSQPICVSVNCNAASQTYSVTFLGASSAVACPEGSTIDAAASSPSSFTPGSNIVCPSYRSVCPTTFNALDMRVRLKGEGGDASCSPQRAYVAAFAAAGVALAALVL